MRRDYSLAALCGGVALGILADRFLIPGEGALSLAVVGLALFGAMFAHRAQSSRRRGARTYWPL